MPESHLRSPLISILLALVSLVSSAQNVDTSSKTMKEADAAFRAGVAARDGGDLELARTKFSEVVSLQPQIVEGHEALGAILMEMGKPADGAKEFEKAAKIKPGDEAIETNLALAYAQSGQPAKAILHFQAALDLSRRPKHSLPNSAFYDAYARALAAIGKPGQAEQQFMAEEALTGPRADLEDAIGTMEAQQEKWDQAQAHFERALSIDQNFARARIHLAVLYRTQQNLSKSLDTLAPLIALDPPNSEALLENGRTLASAGKDGDAVESFLKAAKANPDLPGVQLELAMALQRLGKQQEAVPWFEQAVDRDPHNTVALSNLGLALTLTGKGKEALEYLKRAAIENPKDPVIYKDMGVCHVQLSAFDEAIEDFQKAVALDPNDPQIHYDLGLAYKFKDRSEDSIAELKKAGELDPKLQDPPYTLGILYMQLGQLDEAIVELQKAVALRPENGDAWAILGSTLKQASRFPEAAEALRKAIPLQPGQPGPRVTLAGVLAEEAVNLNTQADSAETGGAHQKAEELRAQSKQLRTEAADYRKQAAELSRTAVSRQKASFALNAGNQQMLRGDIAGAIGRYQEAIASDPAFAEAHTQLAIAYERQGRTAEAAAERVKAADLGKAQ
jgi:protein O-GlcNAc transferase